MVRRGPSWSGVVRRRLASFGVVWRRPDHLSVLSLPPRLFNLNVVSSIHLPRVDCRECRHLRHILFKISQVQNLKNSKFNRLICNETCTVAVDEIVPCAMCSHHLMVVFQTNNAVPLWNGDLKVECAAFPVRSCWIWLYHR